MSNQVYYEAYIRQIQKVQDYIEKNIHHPLTLDELSGVAGFSKYHFSRLFQGLMNESLAYYVNRIRLEKTLFLLAHRPDKNITDIALDLGYSDSAVYARAFKNFYGISPKEYRSTYSKNCKDSFLLPRYNGDTADESQVTPVDGKVHFETLKTQPLMYVRHSGTYETLAENYPRLIDTLYKTCQSKGLLDENNWILAMYHDNPEFGTESQFRTSICLTVSREAVFEEESIVGHMTLEGGLYAVGRFHIKEHEYPGAWRYMYKEWITKSGYVPRNFYPFEVYRNNPHEDKNHMHWVDIYVPIKKMTF